MQNKSLIEIVEILELKLSKTEADQGKIYKQFIYLTNQLAAGQTKIDDQTKEIEDLKKKLEQS